MNRWRGRQRTVFSADANRADADANPEDADANPEDTDANEVKRQRFTSDDHRHDGRQFVLLTKFRQSETATFCRNLERQFLS